MVWDLKSDLSLKPDKIMKSVRTCTVFQQLRTCLMCLLRVLTSQVLANKSILDYNYYVN